MARPLTLSDPECCVLLNFRRQGAPWQAIADRLGYDRRVVIRTAKEWGLDTADWRGGVDRPHSAR